MTDLNTATKESETWKESLSHKGLDIDKMFFAWPVFSHV